MMKNSTITNRANCQRPLALAVFIALFSLLSTGSAMAHRPLWGDESGVTRIPEINTSFAAYEELEAAEEVDLFAVEASAGDVLYGGINIPQIKGLENYSVQVAVVGPGLPTVDHDVLPREHPEDFGAVIIENAVSDDFFEPFTQTHYWGRQNWEVTLPEAGTYYLLVWNAEGKTGKYVIDTGRAEVFGPADIFRFPIWWIRVHAYFEHTPYMIGAGVLLLGALSVILVRPRAKAPARALLPTGGEVGK